MNYFGKTDTGRVRSVNEDCFGVFELAPNATLFALCDGMGGAAGGEIASALALDTFANEVKRILKPNTADGRLAVTDKDAELCLSNAVTFANTVVHSSAVSNPELEGMGTTLVAVLVFTDDYSIYSVNVGDSRLYQFSYGKVKQLTHDDSLVQYLVDTGKLKAEEAETYPARNVILKSIGTGDLVNPTVETLDTSDFPADKFLLLCSDGLSNMLTETQLLPVVTSPLSAKEKVECLITLANQNGGTDNITALLIEF